MSYCNYPWEHNNGIKYNCVNLELMSTMSHTVLFISPTSHRPLATQGRCLGVGRCELVPSLCPAPGNVLVTNHCVDVLWLQKPVILRGLLRWGNIFLSKSTALSEQALRPVSAKVIAIIDGSFMFPMLKPDIKGISQSRRTHTHTPTLRTRFYTKHIVRGTGRE